MMMPRWSKNENDNDNDGGEAENSLTKEGNAFISGASPVHAFNCIPHYGDDDDDDDDNDDDNDYYDN